MLSPYRRRRYGAVQSLAKRAVFAAGMGTLKPSPLAKQIAKSIYKSASQKNTAPSQPLRGKSAAKSKKAKPKTRRQKKESRITRQLRDLKRTTDATTGTLTWRSTIINQRLLCNVNEQASANVNPLSITQYEAVLGQLKYFDPASPGTLTTASAVAGTYQRNMLFNGIYSTVRARNNYQQDVEIRIYKCDCKDDTSQSPTDAWNAGIPDGSNLTLASQLGQYPTDYNVFNDLWATKLLTKQILAPGQTVECKYNTRPFEYDPSTVDTHALTYQKEYRSSSLLVIIRGTVSHDTTLDQQGLCAAGVDFHVENTYTVKYNAGINISYIHADTFVDTPTNGFVQSHQPVPDNVAYSVS